jgi:acyl carrier protein
VPSQEEIVVAIESVIREQLDVPPNGEDIGPDTSLFKGGLELDSFNIVELISELESRFSFEFEEADFQEEHFKTVGSLGRLLDRHLNG